MDPLGQLDHCLLLEDVYHEYLVFRFAHYIRLQVISFDANSDDRDKAV